MTHSPWLSGWRLQVARILALGAVIAITLFVFSIRDQVAELQAYGYPGIFLVSVLANATVILPAPGIALTYAFGAVFHPIGVAIAAGAGAALGELTGYLAGFSGQAVVERTDVYKRFHGWIAKNGFLAVLILVLFLRSVKPVFIIAISIPISVIGTFIFMYFGNISLNVMTLSGLAIGLGMLVDSSIVVLENIHNKILN